MCVIRCSSGLKLFQIDREMGRLGWGRKGEKVEVVSRKIAKYFESTRMYESRRRKNSNGEYGSGTMHLESSWNGRDVRVVDFYPGLEARSGLNEDPCEAGKLHDEVLVC